MIAAGPYRRAQTAGAVFTALALTLLAAALRSRALGAHLWIDEGISIGIARHPLTAIPGVLRQDGSPPLYYALLHVWMWFGGSSERSTHELSFVCSVLAVPAAWWATTAAFGRVAAACAAATIAVSPFVGLYADETRMYALVVLLALLATGAFLRAFVLRRRGQPLLFALVLTALLYTHGWAIFFGAAAGLAFLALLAGAPDRGALLRDGLVGFGGAALLFAPWLPTLLAQAAHTGAPWSHRPKLHSLRNAGLHLFGGRHPEHLLLGAAATGLLIGVVRRRGRRSALAVVMLAAGTLLLAFAWSRVASPAWALRYLVVVMAPLAVALGAGLGRLGPLGLAALAFVFVATWSGKPTVHTLEHKSNVAQLATLLSRDLPRGSLVFSTQPEQVPVLRYYLGGRLRYATPLGPSTDPQVMDWRDVQARLDAARYDRVMPGLLRSVRHGGRVLLIQPQFGHPDSPWTLRIQQLARTWGPRLRRTLHVRQVVIPHRGFSRATLSATLLTR